MQPNASTWQMIRLGGMSLSGDASTIIEAEQGQ